jgi:predicted transposase YdaD
MSKMKIEIKERPTVKAQCLRLLVTLKLDPAKMQLISGFVDTYLRLNSSEEAIFQSELGTMETREQEQIMQITTSWEEKGRLEGRTEGQSNTILRLLNRKLGNLSEEISRQIKSLEPSQLDTLTEDLLDFQTLDDLERWLSNS